MMIQARAVHSQADAHRRDLMRGSSPRRTAPRRVDGITGLGAAQRSASGPPVTGGRAVRRALRPRVGAWLIDFGTRLGGATVRTS